MSLTWNDMFIFTSFWIKLLDCWRWLSALSCRVVEASLNSSDLDPSGCLPFAVRCLRLKAIWIYSKHFPVATPIILDFRWQTREICQNNCLFPGLKLKVIGCLSSFFGCEDESNKLWRWIGCRTAELSAVSHTRGLSNSGGIDPSALWAAKWQNTVKMMMMMWWRKKVMDFEVWLFAVVMIHIE